MNSYQLGEETNSNKNCQLEISIKKIFANNRRVARKIGTREEEEDDEAAKEEQILEFPKRRLGLEDGQSRVYHCCKQEETEAIRMKKPENILSSYHLATPIEVKSSLKPVTRRRRKKILKTMMRQRSQFWHPSVDFHQHQHHDNYHRRLEICKKPIKMLTATILLMATCYATAVFCATSNSGAGSSSTSPATQQQQQVFRSSQTTDSVFGCPYPAVGANCQVNIIAQVPAVPLLSTDYVADEYATLKPDTHASYKCDQGYELLGQETLICLPSGRWSAPPPSCVTNIAIGKPTNQSSTVKGGDSKNANDGRLITQHDSKHCTETRVDQSPWWQIDLLQLYEIRSVRLLGRACCNPQLSLHDIEIRVGNSSTLQGNRLCAWYPNNLDEGIARDFQCAHPIVGRFVSIQMVGMESALSLCEVMVFSTKEFPAERCNVQATLAPSNNNNKQQLTTTTSATTTSQNNNNPNGADNQLIVFNRTCYEMQTSNGGSFLVADTYCKARGGSLLHSVDNLTQNFIAQELERMKSKLKSKLVWMGAKRETSSPNSLGPITPGSTSALAAVDHPAMHLISSRSLTASLDEFPAESILSSGLSAIGEPSPIFSPMTMARTSLYQVSSGAGGSTSRGSQTYGLPTTGQQQHNSNRSIEHPQRSLIISQPSQVASFFTPPVTVPSSPIAAAKIEPSSTLPQVPPQPSLPSPAPSSSPISFSATHVHRSLRPPALVSSTTQAPNVAPPSLQSNWAQGTSSLAQQQQSSSSSWRWVGDAASETLLSPISNFLWADDQPNNYNNQQDCIVLDGGKKWLWNDVTCELDYLPWVCQYRPSTCGSPDRHENSTILELPSSQDGATSSLNTIYPLGKTITYACPVGHRLDGPKQRKCQYDGTWSSRAPKCQYVNCGPITTQPIENGRIVYLNQSQTTFGSQVKYVCYEDYVLVGNDLRQCQADGKWDGKPPFCAYKWCPVLQQIPNGFMNVSSYSENSIASYQCNSGYKLIGNDTRQCLLGGKWTNQEPFCQYVDCGQPKQIANGNYQLINSTTNYLSVVTYSCNENYTLVGNNNKLICSHNNRWTGKEPQCTLIDCGQPQANPGSSFSGDSFSVHSSVDYKCDPGFKEVSGSVQRTCRLDGQWSGQPISCKYVDCGRVPGILKGEVSYINGTTYLASQVAYECTPGNRLSGHRIRFCGPDGRWTGTSPKCEEIRCDAPNLPTNGSAIYIGNDRSFKEQSFSVGVTVQYECDYGHVVKGSWASRLCQANGEWSGEAPICKFVDCGQPPTIENGNYVLKHPPAGSVGSATPLESTRRSDNPATSSSGQPGTFTYYGTIAHYACDQNFKMQGPSQRECLDSGQWRTPLPTCEPVQCPKPEHFDEFTQVSLVARSNSNPQSATAAGETTAAQSSSSIQAILAKSIRLISNNQWINHPDSSAQTFNVADKLYYSCVPGYELYGGPEVRTCTQYGQWSGSSTPRCRLIDCGRPAPIGQEGRFYLLNESTTFNSLVEYSCVRPFKLVEMKIRQAGNLIETLNTAQAGVTPILTSLPIGVKVCANNGQWMPNDQQPKCVSANDGTANGQFDGIDNTLDSSSSRVQVLTGSPSSGGGVSGNNNNNHLDGDNNLDAASGRHQAQPASTSLLAQVIIAICLLVMLALIILTLICIRSGRKPKQIHHHPRSSILTASNHPSVAAAMQIQLANGVNNNNNSSKNMQQQQQQAAAAVAAQQASMMSNQNIYLNGAHKMFSGSMVPQGAAASGHMNGHHHHHHQVHLSQAAIPYGDAGASLNHSQGLMLAASVAAGRPVVNGNDMMMMNGKSSSLGLVGCDNGRQNRNSQAIELPMSSASMMDTFSRLSIESSDTNDRGHHNHLHQQVNLQQANKTIRHNPNGLVTFVSPAQQQHNRNSVVLHQQQPSSNAATTNTTTSQHQVSPQSISTSLSVSSSSSPSSSSSAHHTTATRLSTTDSASSSSPTSNANRANNGNNNNSNGYQTAQPLYSSQQLPQPSPPDLPAHPPPPHRLQQHTKQLMKQQQQLQQQQQQQQQSAVNGRQNQPSSQNPANNHHYMEPTI